MSNSLLFIYGYTLLFIGYCLILMATMRIEPRLFARAPSSQSLSGYRRASLQRTQQHKQYCRRLSHRPVPIIVVDDGSTDDSNIQLGDLCRAYGARLVRHTVNQGKAAALNTGITALGTDLILTIDADTTMEIDDLKSILAPFLDPRTGAVALTIDGRGSSFLTHAQSAEYRYILNFERAALAKLGVVFTVPGAASVMATRSASQDRRL